MQAEFVVNGDFAIAVHAEGRIHRRRLRSFIAFIDCHDQLMLRLLTPVLVDDVLLLLAPVFENRIASATAAPRDTAAMPGAAALRSSNGADDCV